MNKKESLEITSEITQIINTENPVFFYQKKKIKDKCLYTKDVELEHVLNRFLNKYKIQVSDEYKHNLYSQAKKLDPEFLVENPYLKNIKFKDIQINDYFLTHSTYQKGEILLYDMPNLMDDVVYPKLSFFTSDVQFPTLYEGNMPWMSVCPSEIFSMKESIEHAHGKVLVLGLGLGYFPYMISLKDNVESITIVEVSKEVISLFEKNIYPQFNKKVKVIKSDAIYYLEHLKETYDYCFVDIWEGMEDGYPFYKQIRDMNLNMEVDYWIEQALQYYESCVK